MPPMSASGGEINPLPASNRPRKKIDRALKVFFKPPTPFWTGCAEAGE
jgi:hypothetical protein